MREAAFPLQLLGVERTVQEDGAQGLVLRTNQGDIGTRLHEPPGGPGPVGIVWVFGAGGGLGGRLGDCILALPPSSRPRASRRCGWTTASRVSLRRACWMCCWA